MNTVAVDEYGVSEIIRATCITCGKTDCKVAVIGSASQIKLCAGCLVDLANLVFESPESP